jgi:hypothetical protein
MVPAAILIVRAAAGLSLGFFLPGYLLARLLGAANRLLWGFPLSLLLLYVATLAAEMAGLPVTGTALAVILIGLTLIIWGLSRSKSLSIHDPRPAEIDRAEIDRMPEILAGPWIAWSIAGCLCALGALVLWRTALWPLFGADTGFRWDFLAVRMLEQHGFGFYPPMTGDDYRLYFYSDGIPPLVSLSYWWLYVSMGGHYAAATCVLIGAQLACTLGFTRAIGRKIHSPLAGWLAAGILGGSTLFIWGTSIGEETGLTALAMAAMLRALFDDDSPADWRPMALVGLAGALGALAREYGILFPALGCLAILWRRNWSEKGWKDAAVAAVTAVIVAAPWYIRNAVRTGNPLYSNRLGSLYVNPIHAAIIDYYRDQLGVSTWSASDWITATENLIGSAPLQCTLGLIAAVILFRKFGFLAATAAAIGAVWLYSIGFTSGINGNLWLSSRVLTPALVVLSVLGGVLAAGWSQNKIFRGICAVIVLGALGWSIAAATVYPADVGPSAFEDWNKNFFARPPEPGDWWSQLPQVLPQGSRILSDDAYIYVGLDKSGIEIVPIWSPEVEFIGDTSLSPQEVRRQLLVHGIRFVILEENLNGEFLTRNLPFYRQDKADWRELAHTSPEHSFLYELPPVSDP